MIFSSADIRKRFKYYLQLNRLYGQQNEVLTQKKKKKMSIVIINDFKGYYIGKLRLLFIFDKCDFLFDWHIKQKLYSCLDRNIINVNVRICIISITFSNQ